MQKIVTDPIYIRCKKVLESCNTREQAKTAKKYWELACKAKMPDFRGGVSPYLTYLRLWEDMFSEIEVKFGL